MKHKNPKSTKLGGRRRKASSDVCPSTSLPPLVEGQLRCFLRVTVSKILWTVQKPPTAPYVRLRWWGESSDGTIFRPRDGLQTEQREIKTTARFAIRCGPKQFTSYLTDMGMLVLEVMTKLDHLPLGRVQINGIPKLSPTYSISGFYTIVSPTSEKLGEIQVSLALEPLSETYDSSSPVPTTDTSIDTVPAYFPKSLIGSSAANTPRGRDHLYFQENGKTSKGLPPDAKVEPVLENVRQTFNPQKSEFSREVKSGLSREISTRNEKPIIQASSNASKDLISVLLDRGNKLRNAMVVSALQSSLDLNSANQDIPIMPNNCDTTPRPEGHVVSSGNLFKNLLESKNNATNSNVLPLSNYPDKELPTDIENRAIHLLLGSVSSPTLNCWDETASPPDSISCASSIYNDCEPSNPLYDESLLEKLFYNLPKSDTSGTDLSSEGEAEQSVVLNHVARKETPDELSEVSTKLKTAREQRSIIATKEAEPRSSVDLSVEQLASLGQISLARLTIENLKIPPDSDQSTPLQKAQKGKPPRPRSARKCTYFVEYHFPNTSSKGETGRAAMATEVTRAVSSKIVGGVVKFQHRSNYPVHFSGLVIEQWWNTDLEFKIYARKSTQKKPVPFGKAYFPLRDVMQSELLRLSSELTIVGLMEDSEKQHFGSLTVYIELNKENKDLQLVNSGTTGPDKSKLCDASGAQQNEFLQVDYKKRQYYISDGVTGYSTQPSSPKMQVHMDSPQILNEEPRKNVIQATDTQKDYSLCQQVNYDCEEDDTLFHVLLMVPEGKDFSSGSMKPYNVYLNCKFFGTEEVTRSPVIWGQSQPAFSFLQVTPLTISPRLLERMKNNVMVIEVWKKGSGTSQDTLLGLTKLPLHQFYMSFRDPKVRHLLLQAQYPVVGVDSYMPVIDVFAGCSRGSLRVLLAMGSGEQIISLQRLKTEEEAPDYVIKRPSHFLDQLPNTPSMIDRKETSSREHVFEIKVEKVKGLIPLQSTVWGEADCYVQYYFPTQDPEMDSHILEAAVHLHPYRTTTTLCVPDPVFNDCQTHCLVTPAEVPVQRLLLSACSSQGLSGGGAINFEVWCRYYYPNVREQVVARGILPLSKLCAMVTMQRHQNSGAQNFSLPLTPKIDSSDSDSHIQPTGLIDIFIQYKQVLKTDEQAKTGALSSRAVSVVVQVHRAMGLQAAARAIAERDHSFQYPADVGVNAYVEMQLSFLPESEKRTTRVVAKSFCPDFDHHVEFPCNLMIQRSSGESFSLAELCESGQAIFTICHRGSTYINASRRSKDTILGTVKVHLADLVHKRAGISGWFAVCLLHSNTSVESCLQNFGGGLEVSIGFTHHFDRERVIRVAKSMGWSAGYSEKDESDDCDLTEQALAIQIGIPRLWLPLHCLLLVGKRNLERSTYCYTRYKFYDKEALNSSLRHPVNDDDEVTTVTFKDTQTVEVLRNQCFLWYLKEEKLEIQVWVAFGKERRHRPHDTDRLIGSAYIDLSTLAKKPWKKQTISGVYPLFKRGASDLSGSAVRIHISFVPVGFTSIKEPPLPFKNSYVEDILDKEDERGHIDTFFESDDSTDLQKNKTLIDTAESVSILKVDLKNTFAVNITIERAMHLSLKGCPLIERSGVKPSCCVSCATADTLNPVITPVIEGTDSPIWDYQQRTRLSKEVLLDPHQCLVFKVWHKADVERVIGFASVDLSPLLSGFQSVCGWYNIIDFSGQCQGQIKVGITPQEPVHDLKEKRAATAETTEKGASFQVPSLSYQTSATYNSFPTHITRYPEQLINTSVRSGEASLSERLPTRHNLHMDEVRRFHENLQQGLRQSSLGTQEHPPKSTLFTALRKNLSELEDIQRYFNEKLSNTFPNFSNLDASASGSEHNIQQLQSSHDPEGAELISKSAKLVSEMNSLISGLNERSQGIIPEQHVASPPNNSGIFEIPVPLQSHNKENTLDVHLDLQAINISENISNSASSSLVHEEEAEQNSPHEESLLLELEREEEPCTDEEYEEAVIQPITLNDVTALTDKTSPWSSLVSEPEHFAEQPEGAGEPFSEQNVATEGEQRSDTSPMSDSLDDENPGSPNSAITTVTQGVNEPDTVTAEDLESELPSVSFQPACNVEESNCSEIHVSFLDDDSDQSTKISDVVVIPNFFLPTSHLEASMRALSVTNTCSSASSANVSHGQEKEHFRRPRRQKPNLHSSTISKEETGRIAKIFAAQFSDKK
ncbi:C2 domain-containing protein 3 isoform X1 [Erpetoichthys calabaricus]|uniref:C2 domain-containing protein 3 isoform X1 n=1 Tax=Erpetoichthys calabaricus TaxID=27687 RepID=UPI002234B870|nr:C2 domain-containing protein 3 isoform X1 [Erpetoichthys calabaricus]